VFKVAAHWSDGRTSELKTYGLTCPDCLPTWFRRAAHRRTGCRLVPGEALGAPSIYRLDRGQRDQQLLRLPELEKQLTAADKPLPRND
jgi:hypothetical protein